MSKTLILAAGLAGLGACTSETPTPLARLGAVTHLEVVSEGQLTIQLHVDTASSADCPLLGDDVHATFDGMPMHIARGGAATDATGCYPIAFWFTTDPTESVLAYEKTTSAAALEISDRTAKWNVDAHPLFSSNFVVDQNASRIIWQDVDQITTAEIEPNVKHSIEGNAIVYPAGTEIAWVSAYAHPTTTRCDGPSVCTVDLLGSRTLTPINP